MFDTNSFLSQSSSGSFETQYTKVPPGEYPAVVKEIKGEDKQKKDDPSQTMHIVNVIFGIRDARATEVTGLDEPVVRQSIFLDVTPEGKLDQSKNKNVPLGRLLEALGKNGREWSFNDLVGLPCIVKVEHNNNPQDPTNPFVNVTKVGKQ